MQRHVVLGVILAVILASAASAQSPDSIHAYLQSAGVAIKNQQYQKALDNYALVLQLQPYHVEALKNSGVAYSALGNQAKAKELFEQVLEQEPLLADVANNLGVIYSEEGDPKKALEYFERAVSLDSSSAVYLANLGREYGRIGRQSKAIPILHQAHQLAPNTPVIAYLLGTSFADAGMLDSAEVYFEEAAELGHTAFDLNYHLGTVKSRLGKTDEAEHWYKQALTIRPDHTDCLQSLGLLYMTDFRYGLAIEEFKRAVAADSTYYPAWIGLGAAYSLHDETARADTVLARLFAVDSAIGFQMLNVISQEYERRKQSEAADSAADSGQ